MGFRNRVGTSGCAPFNLADRPPFGPTWPNIAACWCGVALRATQLGTGPTRSGPGISPSRAHNIARIASSPHRSGIEPCRRWSLLSRCTPHRSSYASPMFARPSARPSCCPGHLSCRRARHGRPGPSDAHGWAGIRAFFGVATRLPPSAATLMHLAADRRDFIANTRRPSVSSPAASLTTSTICWP
jgi:hypothetical protein